MEISIARVDFKICGKYLFDIWLQAICERTKLFLYLEEGNWNLLRDGKKVSKLCYGVKLRVPESFIANDDLDLAARAIESWPCPGKIWINSYVVAQLRRDINFNFHWGGENDMIQTLKEAQEFIA